MYPSVSHPTYNTWVTCLCDRPMPLLKGGGGTLDRSPLLAPDRDDQMGGKNENRLENPLSFNQKHSWTKNVTPQKSHTEFRSHKKVQKAPNDITPKKSLLKLSYRKNLTKIFLPKKVLKSKILNPKNPSLQNRQTGELETHWEKINKGSYNVKCSEPFVCLIPVRSCSALQHGGFVPRELPAAKGLAY